MNSPWMTRKDAAEYLRCSVDTIDRLVLVQEKSNAPVPGRIRSMRLQLVPGGMTCVRLRAVDVRAILPDPDEETPPR
jgi:hypothetical protein